MPPGKTASNFKPKMNRDICELSFLHNFLQICSTNIEQGMILRINFFTVKCQIIPPSARQTRSNKIFLVCFKPSVVPLCTMHPL